MTNITNQEKPRITSEHIQRTQTIRAMERLMIALGGKHAFVVWLEAMPEDATLNGSGGLDGDTVNRIAMDDEQYNRVLRTFAGHMGPVLMAVAAE